VALLGNLTGSSQFFSDELFYNDVATQSLRFDQSSSARLEKTPNASNRITWTWSAWVKRSKLGDERAIWSVGGSSKFALFFHHLTHQLRVWSHNGEGSIYTNRVFRDLSAWYHICLTSKNSGNYYELYVNGVKETSFSLDQRSSYPGGNEHEVNSNDVHYIGAWNNGGLQYFDGYLADVNFIDGTCVGDTNGILDEFIEIKNGVCIPKKYTGSYGTNGYRLEFKQTGVGTASTTTIGADTSGNTNHYTSSGIVASDCNMPDSPENNFATILSTQNQASATLSEGNLKAVGTGNNWDNLQSTFAVSSGKWYWEVKVLSIPELNSFAAGIHQTGFPAQSLHWYSSNYTASDDGIVFGVLDVNEKVTNTTTSSFTLGIANNSIVQFRLNLDDNELSVSVDGSDKGKLFDITANVEYTPALSIYKTTSCTMNFGQDSTFVGTETAGGNADENGNGDFHSAVPSGYLSLCSANLPEPTISPNADTQAVNHFGTLTYTGDGNQTRTITSGATGITGEIDFQPDWIAHKIRSGTTQGTLNFDSSRGFAGAYGLDWSATTADGTVVGANSAEYGYISGVGTNSFDVNDGTAVTNGGYVNYSGRTYVAWNWKANGGTTTTNDASATSIGDTDSVIQANTDAGFSIVTYTGFSGASGTATVAHGLSQAPEIIIHKSRTRTSAWWVQAPNVLSSPSHFLALTETATPYALSSYGTMSAPTSSVFSINGVDGVGGESANYIAYCFHSVEGYSKIGGSYTGNGSTDGTFVYTGFRPAWVMVKRTDSTNNWMLSDSVRDTDNVVTNLLYANLSNAEYALAHLDFTSNGFKLRTSNASWNASGGTYIYMAFAEAPFKYANAR